MTRMNFDDFANLQDKFSEIKNSERFVFGEKEREFAEDHADDPEYLRFIIFLSTRSKEEISGEDMERVNDFLDDYLVFTNDKEKGVRCHV